MDSRVRGNDEHEGIDEANTVDEADENGSNSKRKANPQSKNRHSRARGNPFFLPQ